MWVLDVFIQLYCLNLNYVEHMVTAGDYEIIVLCRMLGTCYRMQTHCCLTLIKISIEKHSIDGEFQESQGFFQMKEYQKAKYS